MVGVSQKVLSEILIMKKFPGEKDSGCANEKRYTPELVPTKKKKKKNPTVKRPADSKVRDADALVGLINKEGQDWGVLDGLQTPRCSKHVLKQSQVKCISGLRPPGAPK